MIGNESLKELKCCLSEKKHFVRNPVQVKSCGHLACKACIRIEDNIECKICDEPVDKTLLDQADPVDLKTYLDNRFKNVIGLLETEANIELRKLKEIIIDRKESIGNYIEFVKENIDIRVESMKNQLDLMCEKFKNELGIIKSDLYELIELTEKEAIMCEMKLEDVKKKEDNIETFVYEYESFLHTIDRISKELSDFGLQVDFIESSDDIPFNYFGKLVYKTPDMVLRNRVKNGVYVPLELQNRFDDFCDLPDGNLIAVNSQDGYLVIYDENLKRQILIEKINNKEFYPAGIATNDQNHIYILDISKHRVIMTDLKLKAIKTVGSFGILDYQFRFPHGIAYKDGCVYVADTFNERIQLFTEDLIRDKTFQLNYQPGKVKVSSSLLCVQRFDEAFGIYFYDIDDFTLIKSFNHGECGISEIKSYFYEVSLINKLLYCYDRSGDLIEEISLDRVKPLNSQDKNGIIFAYNKNLIIGSLSQLYYRFHVDN